MPLQIKNPPVHYQTFVAYVKELFAGDHKELKERTINHLLYCLFLTWENLFLTNQSRRRLKLLVVERSYNNVGNFLKEYFGGFFEIVNFDDLRLTMVDMVSLSSEYDVIVTDMILEQTTDSEILFFNQMAPSVVANRLTDM